MTIVVWDGKVLATDKAATDGSLQWETTKAWYIRGTIVSGVGLLSNILECRDWWAEGGEADKYPLCQSTDYYCEFLIVQLDGLWRYERMPTAIEHGKVPCAFGSGRAIAFGALAMGANAEKAVEIVNQYSADCGLGVATYALKG